ncbi:MAG: transcriptional repressor [Flavobacteriales bacterium]|nr:transcriptional repressor [Flavobacteriales bacterium]
MSNAAEVLKNKKLRITPARVHVLDIFIREAAALTHAEIEKLLIDDFDRVTLYRTLTSFLENGLIHKVPDESGIQRFAYCNHEHHEHSGAHSHTHVHFFCMQCSKTTCLDDILIPAIKLPEGFVQDESVFLVKGLCRKCSKNKAE